MDMENLFWIGHASFYLKLNGLTVFIDPFKVSDSVREKADLILITHCHFDHCSKDDIEKVRKEDTAFIAPEKCLDAELYDNITISKPGFRTQFRGIEVETVHAYNTNPERLKNHPRSNNWVGYIISDRESRFYHAGDTDIIPEMDHLKNIDVALLPMGGTYTMTVNEAIDASNRINPKYVVPMHYKILLGEERSMELEKKVKRELGQKARIMKEVQDPVYSF